MKLQFSTVEYLISWVLGDYYFEEMKSRRIITNIQNLFTKLIICLAYLLQWPILKDAFTLMYYQYMSEEPPKEKSLFSTKKTDLAAVYIFFCRVYSRGNENKIYNIFKPCCKILIKISQKSVEYQIEVQILEQG